MLLISNGNGKSGGRRYKYCLLTDPGWAVPNDQISSTGLKFNYHLEVNNSNTRLLHYIFQVSGMNPEQVRSQLEGDLLKGPISVKQLGPNQNANR